MSATANGEFSKLKLLQTVLDQNLRPAGGPAAEVIEPDIDAQPVRADHDVGQDIVVGLAADTVNRLLHRLAVDHVEPGRERLDLHRREARVFQILKLTARQGWVDRRARPPPPDPGAG